MLKKIRSEKVLKILFSNLAERKKFEISNYNKSLQSNFCINLIKYKNFSGKYIIF